MALVSYSDSESDSEPPTTTRTPDPKKPAAAPAPSSSSNFNSIVDRSNPRKIRVALPEIKPEQADNQNDEDGPARKKARVGGGGGGGGAFSGFNSFLPAPKRNNAPVAATAAKGPARKVFSLKTGAAPGFDRDADAELKNERLFEGLNAAGGDNGDDETIPKAGSLKNNEGTDTQDQKADDDDPTAKMKKPEEVKLQGNPMMFKPLSVGRAQPKKKKAPATAMPSGTATKATPSAPAATSESSSSQQKQPPKEQTAPAPAPAPQPAPKPKVSLFSLSSDDYSAPAAAPSTTKTTASYEPLVYNTTPDAPPAGPAPPPTEPQDYYTQPTSSSSTPQTLDNIADDLNLSRAQRRHLFGRNAGATNSQVLHFNTDREYVANQQMAHETDLAAQQHNPVRAIAPGKHTLQQLVNAASSQRDALEESFASGRRNKKEAGSKYGW